MVSLSFPVMSQFIQPFDRSVQQIVSLYRCIYTGVLFTRYHMYPQACRPECSIGEAGMYIEVTTTNGNFLQYHKNIVLHSGGNFSFIYYPQSFANYDTNHTGPAEHAWFHSRPVNEKFSYNSFNIVKVYCLTATTNTWVLTHNADS